MKEFVVAKILTEPFVEEFIIFALCVAGRKKFKMAQNPPPPYSAQEYGKPPPYFAEPPPPPGAHPPQPAGWIPSQVQPSTMHATQPRRSGGEQRPTVITVSTNPAPAYLVSTQPLQLGNCPACRIGFLRNEFDICGILIAIVFFPIGILCCLCMMEKRCSHCGARF